MLKGVNKQILEVTNTENPYFEKIIFFVNPEYMNEDREKLKKEAETLAKSTKTKPPKIKHSKKEILTTLLLSILLICAGIAVSFLLNLIV